MLRNVLTIKMLVGIDSRVASREKNPHISKLLCLFMFVLSFGATTNVQIFGQATLQSIIRGLGGQDDLDPASNYLMGASHRTM